MGAREVGEPSPVWTEVWVDRGLALPVAGELSLDLSPRASSLFSWGQCCHPSEHDGRRTHGLGDLAAMGGNGLESVQLRTTGSGGLCLTANTLPGHHRPLGRESARRQ